VVRRVTRTRIDDLVRRLFAPSILTRVQREVYDPVEAVAVGGAVARAVSTGRRGG
jgi:hypothetical protein